MPFGSRHTSPAPPQTSEPSPPTPTTDARSSYPPARSTDVCTRPLPVTLFQWVDRTYVASVQRDARQIEAHHHRLVAVEQACRIAIAEAGARRQAARVEVGRTRDRGGFLPFAAREADRRAGTAEGDLVAARGALVAAVNDRTSHESSARAQLDDCRNTRAAERDDQMRTVVQELADRETDGVVLDTWHDQMAASPAPSTEHVQVDLSPTHPNQGDDPR